MKKKILGLAATLTLVSSIALAAPQSGVYQQMYADGRLKNVVTILHNPGTGDYMAQYSMGDNTYVCFDALDNNGYETENYASKLEETGSGYAASEKCFVIDAANLAKCGQKELFKVNAVKKQGPILSFAGEDRLTVSGAGAKYDGEYYFSPRSKPQANNALMLYAYEAARNNSLFEEGAGANTYRIQQYDLAPWVKRVELYYKDGSQGDYSESLLMDNEFNIVMSCNTEGNASYKPIFVSDKYVQWAENGLASFKTCVGGDESSLYMHRYLAKNFHELTKSNNMTLVFKDFFGGEGENAVFTRLYDLVKDADGVKVLAASVGHSDNDAMQVKKYMGLRSITGDEVRIRKEPNTDCDILGYVNKGDVVEVLGLVNQTGEAFGNKWAAIRLANGNMGYVSTMFIAGVND
ncbi:MAG: SH3 domain-containing protein [Phascolarctobacterium sp.]|nr:SH3 domain-containing protein [Phascolarctobacterium sp.]